MNETELQDRTLQVHIGVPPSERLKASEQREKSRQLRKAQKAAMNKRKREEMYGYDGYGPRPPYGPPGMFHGHNHNHGHQHNFNQSFFF